MRLRPLTTVALSAALGLGSLGTAALPADAAGTGQLTLTNHDVVPSNSSALFNKIQYPADSYERNHDTVSVRLSNTGTSGLVVNSLETTGAFAITSPYKLPFTLASGQGVDVPVTFTATTGASNGSWNDGTAAISWTTGSTTTTTSMTLAGWWQRLSEHSMEPRAQDLVKRFGFGTAMPTSIYNNSGAYKAYSSDEVLNPYWKALDSSQPSKINALAAWRGYPSTVKVSKYAQGSPGTTYTLYDGLKFDSQYIVPRRTDYTRGPVSFTISSPIGFKVDNEFSDPTLNDSSVDVKAGCKATQCGHHLRVFRARDAAANLIPGSYLFLEDFSGINYDYNDNVFLIQNITPV